MEMLKIGDKVWWRGCFGTDAPKVAIVGEMEVTKAPREKYGERVTEVDWSVVKANRVVFTLTNGSWSYSDQISQYNGGE